MARTQTIEVADELKNLERGAIERRDRFYLGVAQGHKRLPSKATKKLLKRTAVVNSPMQGRGSLFKYLSPFWRALSDEQKQVWKDAALYSSINGWQLFISDNAARIRNDISFPTPPSELWQVRTGYFNIQSPASELILKQEHPQNYWATEKITGTPWKSQLVNINEVFGFPLELQFRYKSDLEAVGGGGSYSVPSGDDVNFSLIEYEVPESVDFQFNTVTETRARYYASVRSSYQGIDRYTDCEITINPSTDWTLGTASISNVIGHVIGYTLYIEIVGYRGTLIFDNIRANHSGSNWARDPRCDDITKQFTKGFAIVPPFWIPVSLPSGASFSTVFPPAL